jgi:hypothetical protein
VQSRNVTFPWTKLNQLKESFNPKKKGDKIMEYIKMSTRESDQIDIFEQVKHKKLTQKQASIILKLSLRQIKRRYKRYLYGGVAGLIHKNRGRPSNRTLDSEVKERILLILKSDFLGFGPTFAAEKLFELYSIAVSRETIRQIMIENGLLTPRKKKSKLHVWRERKHCFGQLIQGDGSKHIWFGDKYSTLVSFIDDATGKIVAAMFAEEETIESLSILTKKYLEKHGRPISIYVDRGKVFKVNLGDKKSITQYHRMLQELDIELIFAYSPQAKGRIERSYKTLQDRLVKELFLAKISTMNTANQYLEKFINDFNDRFSIVPKASANLHRSIDGFNLKSIFCIKKTRILNDDYTITYKNRWFQLSSKQPVRLKFRQQITVAIAFDGTITLCVDSNHLAFKEIGKKLPREQRKEDKKVKENRWKPSPSHPWKTWQGDTSKLRKR